MLHLYFMTLTQVCTVSRVGEVSVCCPKRRIVSALAPTRTSDAAVSSQDGLVDKEEQMRRAGEKRFESALFIRDLSLAAEVCHYKARTMPICLIKAVVVAAVCCTVQC